MSALLLLIHAVALLYRFTWHLLHFISSFIPWTHWLKPWFQENYYEHPELWKGPRHAD